MSFMSFIQNIVLQSLLCASLYCLNFKVRRCKEDVFRVFHTKHRLAVSLVCQSFVSTVNPNVHNVSIIDGHL